MKGHTPFKRAREMMHLIAIAGQLANETERMAAMNKIGPYKSRGKGKHHSKPQRNYISKSGNYRKPHQGPKECARRLRQKLLFHPMSVKLVHERKVTA